MRILVVGAMRSANLDDFICNALDRAGHNVSFVGYRKESGRFSGLYSRVATRSRAGRVALEATIWRSYQERILESLSNERPEVALVLKGEAVSLQVVREIARATTHRCGLWYPDDPRFFGTFARFVAPAYDLVMTSSARGVGLYKGLGVRSVRRIAFGFDQAQHTPTLADGSHDHSSIQVAFVGTASRRRLKLVKYLQSEGIKVHAFGPYWCQALGGPMAHPGAYGPEYARICSKARVVLNVHLFEGWGPNMRTFEIPACGGVQVCDWVEGLDDFFTDGVEIGVYRTHRELLTIIKKLLSDDDARRDMAASGLARAVRCHSYDLRAREIMDALTAIP
jgi:spore maturation protein CgeB